MAPNEYYSSWILLSANADTLKPIAIQDIDTEFDEETPREILWTDDFSNLIEVIEFD